MLVQIITILILIILYLIYKHIYKTYSLYHYYIKYLTSKGYKLKIYPYSILGGNLYQADQQSKIKYNDPFYHYKHQFVEQEYDLTIQNIFNQIQIILVNPNLISDYLTPDKVYIYHKNQKIMSGVGRYILGSNVIFTEDQVWKNKRKLINHAFHFDFIQSLSPIVFQITSQKIKRKFQSMLQNSNLAKELKSTEQPYIKVYINQVLSQIFADVIVKSFFGGKSLDLQIDGQNIAVFMAQLGRMFGYGSLKPQVLIFGPSIIKLRLRKDFRQMINKKQKFQSAIFKFIQQHIKSYQQSKSTHSNQKKNVDIITRILQFNQNCQNKKDKYTKQDIVAEFCGIYFAGMDSTTHFTEMMIYLIDLNPHVKKRAIQEVDNFYKQNYKEGIKQSQIFTYQNLKKLKYIDWIQKQITRYFGPSNLIFNRVATKDNMIKDIFIRKGVTINTLFMANHFNPKYFSNPHNFYPERWSQEENLIGKIPPYSFLGFSAGPRACIGKSFAMLDNKIFMIHFLRKYSFQIQERNFGMQAHIMYAPQKIDTKIWLRSNYKQ